MTTTHPTNGEAGGNRGLPVACPTCNAPALRHADGSIYCSDVDQTFSVEQMAEARQLLAARLGAERVATAITESAIREVVRHMIAAAVRANPPQWEDYPEIGEHDWAAVEAEVERVLDRLAAQQEKYDSAYRHLASRAGGEA